MGHKLSRMPADSVQDSSSSTAAPDLEKNQNGVISGQQMSTVTSIQTTQRAASAATAGLLAALRWKKITNQRRGRRSASNRSHKTTTSVGNRTQQQQQQQQQQLQSSHSSGAGNASIWARLIRHLSRKTVAGRRRHRGGPSNDHIDGSRPTGTKNPTTRTVGTSSVLPVSRNPVTSVVAYTDNVGNDRPLHDKDSTDVNSNVATDIVRRITITTRWQARRDVNDLNVPPAPVTSSVAQFNNDEQRLVKQVPRKTIQIQASTSELLAGFGEFLRCRCRRLRHFDGSQVGTWLRAVDKSLIEHAWQDAPFISPANLVLVYLLACDAVDPDIVTAGELQAIVMACLYVAFSYAGCEISYPLKPFISSAGVDEVSSHSVTGGPGKKRFWNRCLAIVERSSGEMLRLNREPAYFAELFRELKTYASSSKYYASTSQAASASRLRDLPNGAVPVFSSAKPRHHISEE